MKLNDKGFAISSIMYMILIMAVILISLILSTLSSRRLIIEKLKRETIKYILNEPVCTLVRDSDNSESMTIGDKYSCEVKDGVRFNFYVLSFNDDESPNLIMERNICEDGTVATKENTCLVAWVSKLDYNDDTNYGEKGNNNKGPITAMNVLDAATRDWNNIPNLNLKYVDEAGIFGTFEITGRARMAYHSEVNDVGCSDYSEASCPLWMIDYLQSAELYYAGQHQENPIDGIYGYWTLSSSKVKPEFAWFVYYYGFSHCYGAISATTGSGVRPVITVPINKIEN